MFYYKMYNIQQACVFTFVFLLKVIKSVMRIFLAVKPACGELDNLQLRWIAMRAAMILGLNLFII